MYNIYREADKKGYKATRFFHMLEEDKDGMTTARRLLAKNEEQTGFISLVSLGAPELTVEAHVLKNRYIRYFDKEICERAAMRLQQYDPDFFNKRKNSYSRYIKGETE